MRQSFGTQSAGVATHTRCKRTYEGTVSNAYICPHGVGRATGMGCTCLHWHANRICIAYLVSSRMLPRTGDRTACECHNLIQHNGAPEMRSPEPLRNGGKHQGDLAYPSTADTSQPQADQECCTQRTTMPNGLETIPGAVDSRSSVHRSVQQRPS